MKYNIPRLMIAAANSGAGKTTVTCGLLKSLKNRNLNVTAFKCGPDYIDPMFHSEIIKVKSRNLDLFFNDENTVKNLLSKNSKDADIAIMEGVMGFYDGIGGISTDASSYHLSKVTKTPTVLVVNCKGMSLSIVPFIKGFIDYKSDNMIKGVILNNISPMIYKEIKEIIEVELEIKVYGYLPNIKDISLDNRHLGLVTAKEVENLEEKVTSMGLAVEETVDIDGLLQLANNSSDIEYNEISVTKKIYKDINIAVALDNAFCFYYEDNLELLRELGANIKYFSPLNDKALPDNISGIIIGGGYPELYCHKLSENKSLINNLKYNIESGIPCIAECGGFMYLHKTMEDNNGIEHKMVGVINGHTFKTDKLGRFGYITLKANRNNLLCNENDEIRGHEFHYWDSTCNGDAFHAKKPLRKRNWYCINAEENVFAGYPHIHFYSNLKVAENFLDKCLNYKIKRDGVNGARGEN